MHIKQGSSSNFEDWKRISNPLLDRCGSMKIITSSNATVGRAEINEIMEISAHNHPQEQITVVIEGSMDIEYDGIKKTVGAGQACIIPGNSIHKVWITEVPFRSFDIFTPIKDDFIKSALENK